MRKWSELEADFRAVRDAGYDDGRLDHQHGAAGEHWRVAGGISRQQADQFEALARLAGQKLLEVPSAQGWPEVVQEKSAVVRWYRALQLVSGAYQFVTHAIQKDEQGNDAGAIFLGRVDSLFVTSATLCTKLESLAATPHGRVEVLCAVPRYAGPCQHWRSAKVLLEASEPDYPGAVHEAVSAVEGLCRVILGDSKITLGDALQRIRKDGRLHPALCKAIEGLWGFASEPGIRHGAVTPTALKPHEARFVAESAEAALALLLAIDGGA